MLNTQAYSNLYKKINSQANVLWNKITFINVAEVLNEEIDLRELDKHIWALKDSMMKISKDIRREVDSMTEDEYFEKWEDAHNALDDIGRAVDDKLDVLDEIVSKLREIADKSEEEEYLSHFKDIDQIDVTESLDYTKLKRFTK